MTKFKRITDQEMEVLAAYMDSDVREQVQFRFAPCSNDEFVGQVFLRHGITKEIIEEVLNIDFGELDRTFEMIDLIRGYMLCNNIINYTKIKTSPIDSKEYCFYLEAYAGYVNRLKKEVSGKEPGLMDLKEDFPEIGYDFIKGLLFYTWNGVII